MKIYILGLCLWLSGTSHAQLPPTARSEIVALYDDGKSVKSQGKLDEAVVKLNKALQLFPETYEGALKAKVLLELGEVYYRQGRVQMGVDATIKSLNLFEETKSDSGIAVANESLALLYWKQNQPEKALDGLHKSLQFKIANDDSAGLGRSYILLGNVYAQQNNPEEATKYFRQSLVIWQTIDHPKALVNLAVAQNNLGNVLSLLGETKEAEQVYLQSLQTKIQLGDSLGIADSYNNIGNFYFAENKLHEALEYFQESARISRSFKAKPIEAVALENVAVVLKEMERYQEALETLWQSDSLHRLLIKDKYSRDVAELQEQFDTEKKTLQIKELEAEKQISEMALSQARNRSLIWFLSSVFFIAVFIISLVVVRKLRQKNSQIETQSLKLLENNKDLENMTATKDKLFSIIAHNLKGPLSALEGVSDVVNYYSMKGQTQKIEDIISEIDKTAFHTNALVDNLLNWARTQTQQIPYQPGNLDLRGVIEQCIELIKVQANVKSIDLQNSIHEECTISADLNFFKTIMSNLLHNAVKFTPKKGIVSVSTENLGDRIEISVKDHGLGIAPERIQELFEASPSKSTSGTEGERGTGLGLYVCSEFVKKEGGELKVESQLNAGSTFRFSVAKSETNRNQ